MYIYRVGDRITWNSTIVDSWLRSILQISIAKYGNIVVVRRIDKCDNTSHSQTIWLGDHYTDRFSGWWFEPIPSGFVLDEIA